ncbi:MAG: ABC transporter permease [Candidatus Lokiarchaeota archaeon]|nr:ABC transporter permease [Candidatus Lokiarchaeota archaeon]
MQTGVFEIFLITVLLRTTLQAATPLVLTALGGMFSEKSGVVNIGLEGMMLMGAMTSVWITYFTDNPWLGVLAGVIGGGLLAAVHAVICVKYKGDHIVSGTGIILFGLGFTTFMIKAIWGVSGQSPFVIGLPKVRIPILSDVPILSAFSELSPIIYMMIIISIVSWYVMYKTPFGLRLRAAGEDPSTLDTAGVNVEHVRYIGVIISGCLAGLGGAYLSVGFTTLFREGMTSGRGFIALAAMIFGNWTPIGCFLAGLFFGFLDGLTATFQFLAQSYPAFAWIQGYVELIAIIPYVLVIVAIAGIRKSVPPKGIAQPYEKERKG